jgi:cation transport regulator
MSYDSKENLPVNVQHALPELAQEVYRAAFNSTYQDYTQSRDRHAGDESREEVSHKAAWAAVKNTYVKGSDRAWHIKK